MGGAEQARAISATSINATASTGGNATCNGSRINYHVNVTGDTIDYTDSGGVDLDRVILRVVDAQNRIIASQGFSIVVGTTLNSGVDLIVGTPFRSTETLVAAMERPFKFEVLESTDTSAGALTAFGPNGPVLVSSATFDPASGVSPFLANCDGLPGGAPPPNSAPIFNDGASANLAIEENTSATSVNNLLDVTDVDTGNTLTWSVTTAPTKGALGGFNTTGTSNGGNVTPAGLTYTPNANQTGADSFVVQVSDGLLNDSITVNVTINSIPQVVSFTRQNPAQALTNLSSLTFRATFSQAVSGVDSGDFTVTGTTATVTGVNAVSGSVYDITISGGNLASVSGVVGATLNDNDSITSTSAATPIGGTGTTGAADGSATSETYTLDHSIPGVVVSPLPAIVSGAFTTTITFDEDVTGLLASELTIVNGTASGLAGGPQVFTATITPTADGAVSVAVPANVAQDAASNGNAASATVATAFDGTAPSVNITSAATGVSGATSFDVTVTFSEGVTGFTAAELSVVNATITALVGGPSIYTATVAATGAGDVAISLPANAASDAAGNGNTASNTLTIAGQTIADTQRIIAEFIFSRANHLVQSQPDLTGFLSGQGAGYFSAQVTRAAGNFSYANKPGKSVWLRLSGSWSDEGNRDTKYIFGAIGSHFAVTPNLLIGGMLEFDYLEQSEGAADIDGLGWLVGPYFVAQVPQQPLFIEGRVLYGQSSNDISPFGTFTDSFDTERVLAQIKASGQIKQGNTTLIPSLQASYTSDDQEAYTDGLNNLIPSQEIELAQFELGLDFITPMPFYTGSGKMDLTGGIAGIQSYTSISGNPAPVVPEYEGGRARVNLGMNYTMANQSRLVIDTFYDGIGTGGFESYGFQFGFDLAF
jgi:hypothetical protein